MISRLALAGLLCAVTACGSAAGSETQLVEREGHYALVVKSGGKAALYPLPDKPTVVIGGKEVPIGAGVGVLPPCNCLLERCGKWCHPFPGWGGPGEVTPRTQTPVGTPVPGVPVPPTPPAPGTTAPPTPPATGPVEPNGPR